jgi:hypothetical protein
MERDPWRVDQGASMRDREARRLSGKLGIWEAARLHEPGRNWELIVERQMGQAQIGE